MTQKAPRTPERTVGPVTALAQVIKGTTPSWRNVPVVRDGMYVRTDVERTYGTACDARLVALAAGSIKLAGVEPDFNLSLKQLRPVTYQANRVLFAANADPEEIEYVGADFEYAGQLVIARGHLVRPLHGHDRFKFRPATWDAADMVHHLVDGEYEPAHGLVPDRALVQSFEDLMTAEQRVEFAQLQATAAARP